MKKLCAKGNPNSGSTTPKHHLSKRIYHNPGITYVKFRQYSEAKAALEKGESLKPEERVYRGWATYYASQKQKKQAIESLQKRFLSASKT